MELKRGKGVWNELEGGWLDPRMKLNEKKSTIGTHEAVVYCPMIDWKTKKKTGLNYKRDVCDALVVSRPWNDCIQKSSIKIQSWLKSKWSRIQWHSNKKINVLVWTNGVNWTILDDWRYKVYEGWASFEKSSHLEWSNGNLIQWKKMNIQQGWRHHADLPLPGVQNSHPVLSNMVQPQQGSWRTDTWRE